MSNAKKIVARMPVLGAVLQSLYNACAGVERAEEKRDSQYGPDAVRSLCAAAWTFCKSLADNDATDRTGKKVRSLNAYITHRINESLHRLIEAFKAEHKGTAPDAKTEEKLLQKASRGWSTFRVNTACAANMYARMLGTYKVKGVTLPAYNLIEDVERERLTFTDIRLNGLFGKSADDISEFIRNKPEDGRKADSQKTDLARAMERFAGFAKAWNKLSEEDQSSVLESLLKSHPAEMKSLRGEKADNDNLITVPNATAA